MSHAVPCKGCGADIMFIRTHADKVTPVNAEVKKVWVLKPEGGWELVDGQESHFSTCPDANKFRTPR